MCGFLSQGGSIKAIRRLLGKPIVYWKHSMGSNDWSFYVNAVNITSKENKQYDNYVFAIVISNLLCIILMLHNLLINKNAFQCYFHFIFCCSTALATTCPDFSFFFLLHIQLLTFCFVCVCRRREGGVWARTWRVPNLCHGLLIRQYVFEIWNIPKACAFKSKEV